jgi:hypothetical protein
MVNTHWIRFAFQEYQRVLARVYRQRGVPYLDSPFFDVLNEDERLYPSLANSVMRLISMRLDL